MTFSVNQHQNNFYYEITSRLIEIRVAILQIQKPFLNQRLEGIRPNLMLSYFLNFLVKSYYLKIIIMLMGHFR